MPQCSGAQAACLYTFVNCLAHSDRIRLPETFLFETQGVNMGVLIHLGAWLYFSIRRALRIGRSREPLRIPVNAFKIPLESDQVSDGKRSAFEMPFAFRNVDIWILL